MRPSSGFTGLRVGYCDRTQTNERGSDEIGGEEYAWQAEVSQQEPDRLVSWRAIDGKYSSGKVMFEPLDANRTRITVEMTYDAAGWKESAGGALDIDNRRVSGDLDRFKEFIEERQTETGAWRSEVHQGTVTDR